MQWLPSLALGAVAVGFVGSYYGRWGFIGPATATMDNGQPAWTGWYPYGVAAGEPLTEGLRTWAWFAFNLTQEQAGITDFKQWGGNTGPMWAQYKWSGNQMAGTQYDPPVTPGAGYQGGSPYMGLYMLAALGAAVFVWGVTV